MTAPLRWTQDNRYIVWTMGDNADLYNLYVAGELVLHNAPFDVFYPYYRSLDRNREQTATTLHRKEAA